MYEMKETLVELKIEDKSYYLAFNLNVMEAIQAEYGTIDEWGALIDTGAIVDIKKDKKGNVVEVKRAGEADIKAVNFGFTEMLNEGMDIKAEETGDTWKPLSKKAVARLISKYGFEEAYNTMQQSIIESTVDEDEGKNE